MAIRVVCKSCRGAADFPDSAAGRTGPCPQCGAALVVAAAAEAPPGALPLAGTSNGGAAAWGSAVGPSLGRPPVIGEGAHGVAPPLPSLSVGPTPATAANPPLSLYIAGSTVAPAAEAVVRSPLPILLGVGGGLFALAVAAAILFFSGASEPDVNQTAGKAGPGAPRSAPDRRADEAESPPVGLGSLDAARGIRRFDPSRPPSAPVDSSPRRPIPSATPTGYKPQPYFAAYEAYGTFPPAPIPPTHPTPRPPSLEQGADRTPAQQPQETAAEGIPPFADSSFKRPKPLRRPPDSAATSADEIDARAEVEGRPLGVVDWEGVLSVSEEVPKRWAVRPDPSPWAPSDELFKIPLEENSEKVQSFFFSHSRQDVAVQSASTHLRFLLTNSVVECWVDVYDLRSKRHMQRFELPKGLWIDSRSPDGRFYLTFDRTSQDRIDLWRADRFQHVVGARPFVEDEERRPRKGDAESILWTGFADSERLWTWNGKGRLVCFQIPEMKALYAYSGPMSSAPKFSLGRAAIGFLTPTGLRWLDSKSGAVLGEASFGQVETPKGGDFCVSPDGAFALMGRGRRGSFVDLATGETDGGVLSPGGFAIELDWLRGSFILRMGSLYCVPSRAVVWRYPVFPVLGHATYHDAPRDGRRWIAGPIGQRLHLVGAPLPHPEAAGAAVALGTPAPVLKRGSKVRFEWACEALPRAKRFRARVEKHFADAGLQTSEDAPLVFRFELTPPVPTPFDGLGYDMKPARTTVTKAEIIVSLLDAKDRSAYWRAGIVCGGDGGALTRELQEQPTTRYLNEAQTFADLLYLPREVYPQPERGSNHSEGMGSNLLPDDVGSMYIQP